MTPEELKKLHEEMMQVTQNLHKRLDQQDTEIKTRGQASGELKSVIEKLNDRLDELETKMARPILGGTGGDDSKDDAKSIMVKQAFLGWCRKGNISPEEIKALSASDDTTGGYLAPTEYVNEIIKGVGEYSPVRSLARVRSTSARAIQIPKRTGQFSAVWVAEMGTRSETTGLTYGLEEVSNHEMSAVVDVTMQELEDSAFNLESELQAEFAEQFGVAEGTAFVSGNAIGKPEGLLTNSSIAEVVSGDANLITADGLISIFYELKDSYAKNASWLLKRSTLKKIRQLKDTTNQYLWAPGLAGGMPATILDRPYVEAVDMPAIAANAYPVLFGDFRRGYMIIDRVQIAVQRDPYTQAATGKIRFTARKRVGGQVVLAEAIKKMKIST